MIGLVDLDLIDGIDVGHVGRYFNRYPCGVPSRGDWTITKCSSGTLLYDGNCSSGTLLYDNNRSSGTLLYDMR